MHYFRRIFVLGLIFICTGAYAFDYIQPHEPLYQFQINVYKSINDYWRIQDAYINYIKYQTKENEIMWENAISDYNDTSIFVGKTILKLLKKSECSPLQLLSSIYKSLPVEARPSMFRTIGFLKVEAQQANGHYISNKKFREYFPGYGYTESGYKYKKGLELDREFKGVTWQSEEQSLSTTWNVRLRIAIDLLSILKKWLTGGLIKNLEVSEPYTINVSKEQMIVVDVSFQRIKAIITKTNRKFEINKVWFQLLKSKSSFMSSGPWEVCGKTYEILQEPTGEMVVTGLQEGF